MVAPEKWRLKNIRQQVLRDGVAALPRVKELIQEYPYFQALRILELELLHKANDKALKKALRCCAVHTTQRANLITIVENELSPEKQLQVKQNNSLEKQSFLSWLNTTSRLNQSEISPSLNINLIDQFIKTNPKISSPITSSKKVDLTKDQKINSEEIMTETLAKVYWDQKKFKKAEQAYKVLSLKYPEKSSFFADLIKKIKADQTARSTK